MLSIPIKGVLSQKAHSNLVVQLPKKNKQQKYTMIFSSYIYQGTMPTQLLSTLIGVSILSGNLAMSVGLHENCPCSVNNRLNLGCRRGEDRSSNSNLEHYHDARGLYGDCLPQVRAK